MGKTRKYELSFDNRRELLVLPVNPATAEYKAPSANNKVNLLNLGEVAIPGHRGLVTVSLQSFFPAPASPFSRLADRTPEEYIATLRRWKDSGKPVRLIVSGTQVNLMMLIDALTYGYREGSGDINYTIELTEYRELNVPAVRVQEQPKRPDTRAAAKTHTVVRGDTLWGIAKRYYGDGAKWRTIYNANKAVVGSNPDLIFAGQRLVIP